MPIEVPLKESTRLMTVYRNVGRLKIEHQLARCLTARNDELFHQLLMNHDRLLALGALLESAKSRGTRQPPTASTRGLNDQTV